MANVRRLHLLPTLLEPEPSGDGHALQTRWIRVRSSAGSALVVAATSDASTIGSSGSTPDGRTVVLVRADPGPSLRSSTTMFNSWRGRYRFTSRRPDGFGLHSAKVVGAGSTPAGEATHQPVRPRGSGLRPSKPE